MHHLSLLKSYNVLFLKMTQDTLKTYSNSNSPIFFFFFIFSWWSYKKDQSPFLPICRLDLDGQISEIPHLLCEK